MLTQPSILIRHNLFCFDKAVAHTSAVPAGSLSRGGDVALYVFDINQPSLPTPIFFYFLDSVPVSISVFMALSTVFLSINAPNNSPLSHSVLPVLFLFNWSFQL